MRFIVNSISTSSLFSVVRGILRAAMLVGERRLASVLVLAVLQSIFGVVGVVSVGPLLAAALRAQDVRDWLVGAGFGAVSEYSDQQIAVTFALLMVVTVLIATALNLYTEYQRSKFCFDVVFELRAKILGKLQGQPYARFVSRGPNATVHVLQNVTERLCGQVLLPALQLIAKVGTAALLVAVLLVVDSTVTLIASAAFGSFFAAFFLLARRGLRRFRERMIVSGVESQKRATELISGIKTLRVNNAEAYYASGYLRVARNRANAMAIQPLYSNAPKYLLECLLFITIAVFLVISVLQSEDLVSQLSRLGVVALAAYRLLPSCQQIYFSLAQLSAHIYLLDEMHRDLESLEDGEADEQMAGSCPLLENELSLDALSFRYPNTSSDVLDSVSLVIKHGASVGVSGESGAGKSTLVDILLGLYSPTRGAIKIDGTPLTKSNVFAWRSQVGYVPQDVFLIDDTIKRNIAIGQPDEDIDHQRVEEVAKVAQIASTINSMPEGFETIVGDRGARLSGGQKQRLALARALYFRPRVLVMDEATSALDNGTEASLIEAVEKLHGSITIIMIAHRLSTLQACDIRVELADGKLASVEVSKDLPSQF